MGVTIVGSTGAEIPFAISTPMVYLKSTLNGTWYHENEMEFLSGSEQAAGNGLGYIEIARKYGRVKESYQTSFADRASWNLVGWWVQVRFVNNENGTVTTAWSGQIVDEVRDIYGDDNVLSGAQTWVAYAPSYLLEKYTMSACHWYELGVVKKLGWIPAMNERDERNRVVGNRSTGKVDGTYIYGGSSTWSNYDYAEYVLSRFTVGNWYLSGQADLLKNIYDSIAWEETQTVFEVLRRLIPRDMGVDFHVILTDWGGFIVQVYALTAETFGFAGAIMPRNPNTVNVELSGTISETVRATVVRSRVKQYSSIRVLGARIVVCCSLSVPGETLEAKWGAAIEAEYLAGTGTPSDSANKHDDARRRNYYDSVFQRFGAVSTWGRPAPALWNDGNPSGGLAQYQRTVRETLTWLPLREGFDYSSNPATNNNPSDLEAEFMLPMAWLYDEDTERYVPTWKKGITVYVPENDWGIFLECPINHVLGLNRWSGAEASNTDATDNTVAYDYDNLFCTIAVQTDQRLELVYDMSSSWGTDGTQLDVYVPDAEFWYLAPDTIVGVDADGELEKSGTFGRVLRNDTSRIGLVMAGAIARYFMERGRAEIVVNRLVPWSNLVGQILAVVQDQGSTQAVQAPITSVEWSGGNTIIRTGFAG